MAATPDDTTAAELTHFYDQKIFSSLFTDDFGFGEFMNFGYWDAGIQTPAAAGENLVRKLIKWMPANKGPVLDVACGKGASTALLMEFYPAENITGINISEKQLARCRENAPGCTFQQMDAVELDFEDESFEGILCVEAAFHFNTRQKFLQAAHRVLKPGGQIVLSDVLMTREGERTRRGHLEENYAADPEEYKAVLHAAGFDHVDVVDATKPCWHAYYWHWVDFFHQAFLQREISLEKLKEYLSGNYQRVDILKYYLLAHAQKA